MQAPNPALVAHAVEAGHWEHFDHNADIGVRGVGPTKEVAFEQAALALMAVVTDPKLIQQREMVAIECASPDTEVLFVEWLNAIVYQISRHKMLFSRFDVSIQDHHLTARMWGESVSVLRHQPAVEIKGATFTELRVTRIPNGRWLAQCVVDV